MNRTIEWGMCIVTLAALVSTSAACTAIFGLDEKSLAGDGGTPKADAGPPCTPDDAGYNDFQNAACWSTFTVTMRLDGDPEYSGGTFDGRYVYFPSNVDGLILRYDTSAEFGESASWGSFDTGGLADPSANSAQYYSGAVFDGRFAYFVPNDDGTNFLRYDTSEPFFDRSSWSTFAPSADGAPGYQGGTYDGRYVYFAPNDTSSFAVARYDTKAAFTDRSSWLTFDPTALNASANAFSGAIYDGRYVYLPPSAAQVDSDGDETNVALRFDTTLPFGDTTSWATFDLGTLPANSEIAGFQGGIYDGTSVYFVPQTSSAVVLRLDPTGTFTSSSAWSEYGPEPNLGQIGVPSTPTFAAGAFDGRHLYFVPSAAFESGNNGVLVQHDLTVGPFSSSSSWSTYDTTHIRASDFGAAVFDGRYLYLPPGLGSDGVAARFQARQTPSQPALPDYFGSFF